MCRHEDIYCPIRCCCVQRNIHTKLLMSSSGSASVFRRVRKNFKCRSHEIRPVLSLHRPSTNGAATCTRKAHAHVLPRARSMADACAYSVRGARFFIAVQLHSLGVTDTNIHIIIARMQPGLGCLALVCSAIISCRILQQFREQLSKASNNFNFLSQAQFRTVFDAVLVFLTAFELYSNFVTLKTQVLFFATDAQLLSV